jgi:hypothetical protein
MQISKIILYYNKGFISRDEAILLIDEVIWRDYGHR